MSRPSKLNPRVSAYTLINGFFDFNITPLAPAGIKTIVHDRATERASWAQHGSRGFYIGPAMKHFRCYRNLMVVTKSTRTSNTVEFFPRTNENPLLTEAEKINLILQDLLAIVSSPCRTLPSLEYGDDLSNAVRTMQTLMCKNKDGTQRYSARRMVEPGVPLPEQPVPRTRSTTYVQEPVGTIVRKRFNDGKFYEGEVTKYNPINKYYTIKFVDGDIEEYDQQEMKKYKKKNQAYSQANSDKRQVFDAYLLNKKYDKNIFFIPTKACPNPVKLDYKRQ